LAGAFFFAGTPRTLCSFWRATNFATRTNLLNWRSRCAD
jgi:hypothetical protein